MKVFSKEKCLERARELGIENAYSPWMDERDGKPVIDQRVNGYIVSDNWCIEKEDKPVQKYTMKDFIEKKIAVKISTVEERDKFLKMCEAENLRWNGGETATSWTPYEEFPYEIACSVMKEKRLSWGYVGTASRMKGYTVVDSKVITDESTPTYEIHIKCVGDVTTAEMVVNGKVVKSSKAKRDPRDKFSFKVGAEYAFNRLFEKKEKEVKTPEKLTLGDRVKVTETTSYNKKIVGQNGTIIRIDSCGDFLVRFDKPIGGHGVDNREWWISKMDEGLTKVEKEFKIGDKVKCISPHDGNMRTVGKIGVINASEIALHDLQRHYRVDFDNVVSGWSDKSWWFTAENLVHV